MTKATASIAAILTLLTGLLLGQIGSLALHADRPERARSYSSPQALATARSFYDGMNRLLASGDRSIETTVAPGFVDHTLSEQQGRTLPEMIDWLLAMRATWPHVQMRVVDLEQKDRLIAVRLEFDPGVAAPIPGVPLTPPAPSRVLEFLRVEGSGVTDRWDADTWLPVATFSVDTDVDWNGQSLVVPAIEHLSLDPGRSMQLPLDRTVILRAESGRVQLDRAGTDLDGNRHPAQEPLDAGTVRILAGAGALTLRNVSSEAAEVWAVSANGSSTEPEGSDDAAPEPPRQPRQAFVAFMPLQVSSDMAGRQHLSVTQISLPPGATVADHVPGIIEEIAVLDGSIQVTIGHGRALKCTAGNMAHPFDGTETIAAGEGVSAKGTASLGYRVTGPQPATFLIMRIEAPPASEGPTEPLS